MITETPANHARARIEVDGRQYDVIEVDGEESLNLSFYLNVTLLGSPAQDAGDFLEQRFQLELLGRNGGSRYFSGVVVKVVEDLNGAERKRFTLGLEPRFRALQSTTGPVVWIGLDFRGLAQTLLEEAGVRALDQVYEFQSEHKPQPWLLRGFGESSHEMLLRRMAREGIFCWVDSVDGEERLVFADHNARCPYLRGGPLREAPQVGLETSAEGHPQVGVYAIEAHHVLQPGAAIGYVLPASGPACPRAGEPRASDRPGLVSGFGIGAQTLDEASAWAKLRDEYHDVQAHFLHIRANRVDLAPGHCLTLESERHAGDYLVTAVRHRTAQAAGPLARGATLPYACEAWLIPRARPYRGAFPPKRQQPDFIDARLVSHSPNASLDEQGRYRVRTLFEPGIYPYGRKHWNVAPELESLRRLTPHAGPRQPQGKPTGFHAPGLDDEPVLLGCLNDDPDRLLILGSLYDTVRPSPVTWENPSQNRYRSASGNALLMDDHISSERIRLHPVGEALYLELNAAKVGQWVGIATPEGAIEQRAGKTIQFKSGGDHEEQIGNDRIQQVENNSVTTTRQGKIHYQAGSDIQLDAGESIHLEAGQDLEISAGGDFHLSAKQDAVFRVRQGDHLIQVDQGHVHIQARGDIWIEGDGGGPILFEQQGGGLEIGAQGDMRLFGNAFNANFREVIVSGQIEYEIPGGQPGPVAKTDPPLEATPIEELLDPREPMNSE